MSVSRDVIIDVIAPDGGAHVCALSPSDAIVEVPICVILPRTARLRCSRARPARPRQHAREVIQAHPARLAVLCQCNDLSRECETFLTMSCTWASPSRAFNERVPTDTAGSG
jgi:hypothetical protein